MQNLEIKRILEECQLELDEIKTILSASEIKFDKLTKYLTNYAVIRACSTIEFCCKKAVADFFEKGQSKYIREYLSKTIRKNSSNPSLDMINSTLKSFGGSYNDNFNRGVKKKKKEYNSYLQKLREARNNIAHGYNINITISTVMEYYKNSEEVIKILDSVLIQ